MQKKITAIQQWQKDFISQYPLLVLRDKKTAKAITIAWSIEGFIWTTDIYGRYLFVEDQSSLAGKDIKALMNLPYAQNKLNDYIVEPFIPRDHINTKGLYKKPEMLAEYHFCNKALAWLSLINLSERFN